MAKLPRGLPKSYIKKWGISKLAWRKFRAGALTKGIRTRTKAIKRRLRRAKGKSRKRRVIRTVRRRRGRRRGGKSMMRTAFKFIRLGALLAPAAGVALRTDLTTEHKVKGAFRMYTGYDMESNQWKLEWLASGWLPYLGACVATYGIPKLTAILRRI